MLFGSMGRGNSANKKTMDKASTLVSDLIGRVCPALPLGLAIKAEWHDIVGEEMVKFASFSEVKFGIENELTVIVEVLSSASLIFRYSLMEIKDKISKIAGYSVTKINLIIKQVSSLSTEYRDVA